LLNQSAGLIPRGHSIRSAETIDLLKFLDQIAFIARYSVGELKEFQQKENRLFPKFTRS